MPDTPVTQGRRPERPDAWGETGRGENQTHDRLPEILRGRPRGISGPAVAMGADQ